LVCHHSSPLGEIRFPKDTNQQDCGHAAKGMGYFHLLIC
jgi:hypothetical protein